MLLDATIIIASASIAKDRKACWVGDLPQSAVHGSQPHVATDAAAGIVRRNEMTSTT